MKKLLFLFLLLSFSLGAINNFPSNIYTDVTVYGDITIDELLKNSQVTTNVASTASTKQDIVCDATSGAFTVQLPAVTKEAQYMIVKIDSSANAITVSGNLAETINGELTQTLTTQWDFITVFGTDTQWITK